MRAIAFGAAFFALVVTAPPARAEPREDSRASFRRGVALAEAGDYTAARDAFLEAYRLFAHPSILLNLGIARWRTGEYAAAEEDLATFLSDDGGATAAEIASARMALSQTRDHLGTLRVRVRADGARATLDGRPIALVPGGFAEVRAVDGPHTLVVDADGYQVARAELAIARGQVMTIDRALAPTERAGDPLPSPDEGRGRRTAGWVLVGASVAAAGFGTYAGVRALHLSSDYGDPASPSYRDPSERASGLTLRTAADVSFGAAILAGALGAYLLVVHPGGGRKAAALVVGPGFLGLRGEL